MNDCITIETIAGLHEAIERTGAGTIGLVPTMGALHRAHAELIKRARRDCDLVVVSVFVNPLQFGPSEDLDTYPRNLRADKVTAERAGADLIFAPGAGEIIGANFMTAVSVPDLTRHLCGPLRPGHFSGVAVIVSKLFNIVKPQKAYFGEKDWQQLQIVKRVVADLNFNIQIISIPTMRDPDGLAVSSRNGVLSPGERQAALVLPRALAAARTMVTAGQTSAALISAGAAEIIAAERGVELEYFSVCRPDTLEPADEAAGDILLAGAIRVGRTRLIDNVVIRS